MDFMDFISFTHIRFLLSCSYTDSARRRHTDERASQPASPATKYLTRNQQIPFIDVAIFGPERLGATRPASPPTKPIPKIISYLSCTRSLLGQAGMARQSSQKRLCGSSRDLPFGRSRDCPHRRSRGSLRTPSRRSDTKVLEGVTLESVFHGLVRERP